MGLSMSYTEKSEPIVVKIKKPKEKEVVITDVEDEDDNKIVDQAITPLVYQVLDRKPTMNTHDNFSKRGDSFH